MKFRLWQNNFLNKLEFCPCIFGQSLTNLITASVKTIKSRKGIGQIINIGSEFEVSIEDLVKIISKNMNKKLVIKIDGLQLKLSK